jgi:gas vesicle protein
MRNFSTFIVGAVCGALVGSVIGLLLAPESGEKLRQQISERTGAFRDEVQSAYNRTRKTGHSYCYARFYLLY